MYTIANKDRTLVLNHQSGMIGSSSVILIGSKQVMEDIQKKYNFEDCTVIPYETIENRCSFHKRELLSVEEYDNI